MNYFVRSGGLIGFPELVREYGENPSELLRAVGLSTAVLHNRDLYIPYQTLADLFELAASRCKAADFGVRLGGRQGLHVVGALGSLICLQGTVPDALEIMQRNLDFHARGVNIDVERRDDHIDMRLRLAFGDGANNRQLAALSTALLCRSIAQLHQEDLAPLEVFLDMDDGGAVAGYSQVFAAPIHFNAGENRLVFSAALLDLAVNPSPDLRRQLSQQWRGNWGKSDVASLPIQVERAITALLPTGGCSLEIVARIVDLHPRVLQERLLAEGSSFSQLLQRVRLRLACHYLQSSDMDLTNLALNLGFAELAVFSRAFKKWTGHPPREWRKKALKPGGGTLLTAGQ